MLEGVRNMEISKKILSLVLILIVLNLSFTSAVYANADGVTGSAPEMLATGEEDIPVEKIDKKISYWLYVLGGVLIAGGAAAAASGGGGGGGDGDTPPASNPPPASTTGDVAVTW